MDRRAFIVGSFAAIAVPLAAEAQQTMKPVKIGWIAVTPRDRDRGPEQFRPIVVHHLRQRGWEPHFELRYAAGDQDRLARMAAELVKAHLDVIVAPDTNSAVATKKATPSIPIVMSSADPLGAGLVASLARPGANVTGVSAFFDDGVAGKWGEFLREVLDRPSSRRRRRRLRIGAAASCCNRVRGIGAGASSNILTAVSWSARPGCGGASS